MSSPLPPAMPVSSLPPPSTIAAATRRRRRRRRRRSHGSSTTPTSGDGRRRLSLLPSLRLLLAGTAPSPPVFTSLFASSPSDLSVGMQLHAQAILRGHSSNAILSTAILGFYLSCRQLPLARHLFDAMPRRNAATWNSLIKGYAQMGRREEAFELFRDMKRQGLVAPDEYTYPALLSGVGREGRGWSRQLGGAVHAEVIKAGLEKDAFVGACLVSMYSAQESLRDARLAFRDAGSLDPVVWSSMVSACVSSREGDEALCVFTEMLCLGISPTQFVYSNLFSLCGSLSMLETGRQVHAHGLKNVAESDAAMHNALLTMYSDCGCIGDARRVFASIDNANAISFNSMISALAQHGSPGEGMELFGRMKHVGLTPDEVTMLNLLSAFNHAGLVREGLQLFHSMERVEGIQPLYQHYACVVDMLARSGEIEEAIRIIDDMPFEADASLWRIILGACSKHRDISTGRQIAEMLFEMEPREAASYTLLANIYARLGRCVEAEKVRGLMEERGIEKEDAFSWIEMDRRTYRFGVEDRSHPLSEEIYRNLDKLINGIKVAGYVPDISFAAHNIDKDRREESLYYHCEKLAFAFGDLSAPAGATLRIMKNLRVCGDCHCAYKYFSLITGREIVLRDKHRFHHFNKGACSCGNYW